MNPLQINKDIPFPAGHYTGLGITAQVRATLKAMEVGDSFCYATDKTAFRVAKELGIRITTARQPDLTFIIWRKS